MAHANPDDGLVAEISEEYKSNRPEFERKARAHTLRHASQSLPQETQDVSAGQKHGRDA